LAYAPTTNRRPTDSSSPPQVRPATPGTSDVRVARQTPRHKTHAPTRSQHSHSGSIFHNSDAGSDYGHPFRSSPPPVPPMPDTRFGAFLHGDGSDYTDEDRIEP